MHYYQFNIGDYKSATSHLTNEEDLAYRRLLDMYYDSESKIPLDTQWVAKRIRVEASVIRDVLNDMFIRHEDGYFHARCQQVIDAYHSMAEKNRANGRLGGRKKNPVGNPVDTDSQPIAKATINHKLETRNDKPINEDFEEFWKAYPKKTGKDLARAAFAKRKVNNELLQTMLKAIAQQKNTDQWKKENGQFIPMPATWLNQGRWQDEVVSLVPDYKRGLI